MTPRGAAGMNTAIHDGYDLGWKLGWVLRSWADESLLDSFEAERRPVGLRNMTRSAVPSGERDVSEDYLDDIADRIPHVWLPDGRTSTLDLLGEGLTVLAGPNAHACCLEHGTTCRSRCGSSIRRPPTPSGSAADGLVLVRPDGLPIARWVASADASSVAAAVSEVVRGTTRQGVARAA